MLCKPEGSVGMAAKREEPTPQEVRKATEKRDEGKYWENTG